LLPKKQEISIRPMFGNLAAFVRGNLSVGLYGEDLFVRLAEPDRVELLANNGAALFEPMEGRKMKEYVVVPRHWRSDPNKIRPWVARSLEYAGRMPAKAKKR